MDGNVFPDLVVVTYDQLCILSLIFQVLGRGPYGGKRTDDISGTDCSGACYDRVGFNRRFPPDFDPFLNDYIGTYFGGAVQFCSRIHYCCWMYVHISL